VHHRDWILQLLSNRQIQGSLLLRLADYLAISRFKEAEEAEEEKRSGTST
jgi:hypothetical protein